MAAKVKLDAWRPRKVGGFKNLNMDKSVCYQKNGPNLVRYTSKSFEHINLTQAKNTIQGCVASKQAPDLREMFRYGKVRQKGKSSEETSSLLNKFLHSGNSLTVKRRILVRWVVMTNTGIFWRSNDLNRGSTKDSCTEVIKKLSKNL